MATIRADDLARQIKRLILVESKRANVGHIGSALSVADIVAALYAGVFCDIDPGDPRRSRFVMSKGHAALAMYAALHLQGWLSRAELATYCGDGTTLGVHPDHRVRGIDFSTGSLGQGLSFGVGAALAARLQGDPRPTFVLLSDAECNEGAVWEAAAFAAQHGLASITAIVDQNGQQALGYTRDVLAQDHAAARWRSSGWDATTVDGHDVSGLQAVLAVAPGRARPMAIIAETTFGRGVSFMERQIAWHYLPMDDAQYEQAMTEVDM